MGHRIKRITTNCASCDHMDTLENAEMICKWGKGKPKILKPQLGKKPLTCRLIGD